MEKGPNSSLYRHSCSCQPWLLQDVAEEQFLQHRRYLRELEAFLQLGVSLLSTEKKKKKKAGIFFRLAQRLCLRISKGKFMMREQTKVAMGSRDQFC